MTVTAASMADEPDCVPHNNGIDCDVKAVTLYMVRLYIVN